MVAFRRLLVAGFATLLVAGACTSINVPTIPPLVIPPGASIPPLIVPSIPPINFPSIPPINLPSGIVVPPIGLPSGIVIPPIDIPSGSIPCGLVSGAEVGQILGAGVTDVSDSATNCSFISTSFWTISVSMDDSTDFTGARVLLGSTAQDATIGGFPALTGTALGVPAIYVQKPSGQLTVLGILNSDPTIMSKLQQIATIAVGRMP
jgi:hypothetical protein